MTSWEGVKLKESVRVADISRFASDLEDDPEPNFILEKQATRGRPERPRAGRWRDASRQTPPVASMPCLLGKKNTHY